MDNASVGILSPFQIKGVMNFPYSKRRVRLVLASLSFASPYGLVLRKK
jgi:hypothetical protein